MSEAKEFELKVDDKYHKSYLTYGIDYSESISNPERKVLTYELLTHRADGSGVSHSVVIPDEDVEEIIEMFRQVDVFVNEHGSELVMGSKRPMNRGVTVQSGIMGSFSSLPKAYELAYAIEEKIMSKHPELREPMGISKTYVQNREREEQERKQADFDSLSLATLKERYPSMFDEKGELKKEAVRLIIQLIDNFATEKVVKQDGSIERVPRM